MLGRTFIDALASADPTPGGGGASAYCGALASALSSMVGNLTVGKKKYADVEAETYVTLQRLEELRERLLELITEDARAFEPLAAAYGMPKNTPEEVAAKEQVLQEALIEACEVPLEIMMRCGDVIQASEFLAYHGSRIALSDVGVAVVFAKAALQGASLNVFINIASMKDTERAEKYRETAEEIIRVSGALADELYDYVRQEIV